MDVPAGEPILAPQADSRRLGQVIASISHLLSAERIGTGALAELRRITGEGLPPAFWRLYLADNVVPPYWRDRLGTSQIRVDRAWASLIRAMVEMAPIPHSFKRPFGTALAESGYSVDRFVRLVRAKEEQLAREVRIAGPWLARQGVGQVNWETPARLLLADAGIRRVRREWAVHQLQRHFFRVQATQSKA